MSPSDRLKDTQDKMQKYLDNGVKLGWLINRKHRQVEIYRQGEEKKYWIIQSLFQGKKFCRTLL